MATMRRMRKWFDENAEDVIEMMAWTACLMMVIFFGGCCVIGMIKLWALMW